MLRQLLTTLIAMSLLGGLGWGYHAFVNPMLIPPDLSVDFQIPVTQPENQLGPIENRQIAEKYLGHVDWVQQDPPRQFKVEDRFYIFAQKMDFSPDQKTIKISPFAMIMLPAKKEGSTTNNQEPITVVCESANIEFNEKFGFDNDTSSRVIKGQLRGLVDVRGGKGLRLQGTNFVYSEEAMNVVCDDKQIQFQYDGNSGTADGLVVNLVVDEALKRDGEIPIKEVSSIRLRQNVQFEYTGSISTDQDETERKNMDGPVSVSSEGSLIHDMINNVAIMHNNVQVHRQNNPGDAEHIYCNKLKIEFASEDERNEQQALNLNTGLNDAGQFKSMTATGDPVRLISQKQDLIVETANLVYDYKSRTADLGGPWGVRAQMDGNHLECPRLQLIHNEKNDIESVVGLGRGQMVQRDKETNELKFRADWQKQLHYKHDFTTDQDLIELDEQALFRVPAQKFATAADRILVRLVKDPLTTDSKINKPNSKSKRSKMQPAHIRAEQNVHIQVDQIDAHNELTEVWFQEQRQHTPPPITAQPEPNIVSVSEPKKPKDERERRLKDPVKVASEKMNVIVNRLRTTQDEKQKIEYKVHEAIILGDVLVKQTSETENRRFDISGDRVRYQISPTEDELISVFGQPAKIHGSEIDLQGFELVVDPETNQAEVVGAGQLQLQIPKDFEGNVLDTPDILTITWQESMKLKGNTASFYGDIVTDSKQNHSNIQCQQMHVRFTDSISFSGNEQNKRPEIKQIECREHVHLLSKEFEAGKLKEVRKGELWVMTMNPQTGETVSTGPGHFEIWSQEKNKDNLASLSANSSVMSNNSLTVETAQWQYIHIGFNKGFKGNIKKKMTTFEGGVEIIYGPVDHPQQVVFKDQLSGKAGTMQCQKLVIDQRKMDTGKNFVELQASGNVRLESQKFHALSDMVTYDQSKERYDFRSKGSQNVYLWRQEKVGGSQNLTTANWLIFFPKTGKMRSDKTSIQSTQ